MSEPVWPSIAIVKVMHQEQLFQHGGLPGIRDENLLESALAYPQTLFTYEPETNLVRLGAAYAACLAKNHPFVDGNKRTAWLACFIFLRLNGCLVFAPEAEVVVLVNGAASVEISEEQFTHWLAQNTRC